MKTENRTKIISVWLDETSEDHGWIVDIDIMDGGESDTIKTFPPTATGEKKAIAFALGLGSRKNLPVYRDGDRGQRELLQADD